MLDSFPRAKRTFDLTCIILLVAIIAPILAVCALAILMTDGAPVFYRSRRRVVRNTTMPIVKFRTMRRDADKIVNRDVTPVTTTRFLNIPTSSPLYTPVGRIIERLMLTEIPQLIHVLQGHMSLVGNRPLPENVIAALKRDYPDAEARFDAPTGLTGVAQLVGREFISDSDRLRIEIAYCRSVFSNYSWLLDIKILAHTVLLAFSPRSRFTIDEVVTMLERHSGAIPGQAAQLRPTRRQSA